MEKKKKDIKKEKPEKKKRKPIYEVEGFILEIPEESLNEILRDMTNSKPKKE